MPEIALISLLLFGSVLILALNFTLKPQGVSLNDEYKKTRAITHNTNKTLNFIIGCCVCAVFAWIVTGQLLWVIISLPGGYWLAKSLNGRKERARNKLLGDQYKQVLSSLMITMQGGASPYQAFEETITALNSPAKDVFVEIVRRARTGSNYEDALNAVAQETGWEDLKSLQMALSLYSKTGCDLVVVLKHLLNSVYDSQADRKYVEGVTASSRATTVVLSILPFFLMAYIRFVAPEFSTPLFTTTPGFITIVMVVGLVLAGNKIVSLMIDKVQKAV